MKRLLLVLVGCGLLAGCSQGDSSETKKDIRKTSHEMRTTDMTIPDVTRPH